MIDSTKFSVSACRVFCQIKAANPTLLEKSENPDTTADRRQKFRALFLAELGGLYGLTAEAVSQKLSALKGQYVLPPVPQGRKGRQVKPADKAASDAAGLAAMADAGFAPVYGDDGKIVDWSEVEVETA